MSDTIPLTAPDGTVYAYACAACRRVSGGVSRMVEVYDNEDVREMAAWSREGAERCCTCRRCHGPAPHAADVCAACKPEHDREWAEHRARHEAAEARGEVEREESLSRALDRDAALALEERMSAISEECYCAGWLIGLEHTLWQFCADGPGRWGIGEVSAQDIADLQTLSIKAGGWWWRPDRRDGSGGGRFATWAEWDAMRADAAREEA